jgi:nitrate reductase gamma subunit
MRYHLLLAIDDDLLLFTGARLLHFAPIFTELMVVSVFAILFFKSAQREARARDAKGLTLLAAGFATGFATVFGAVATTGARIFDRRAEISRSLLDTSSLFLAEAVRPAL